MDTVLQYTMRCLWLPCNPDACCRNVNIVTNIYVHVIYSQYSLILLDCCRISSNIVEMLLKHIKYIIISPNAVFGDIMFLASPPPRPLVDPDVVNALT